MVDQPYSDVTKATTAWLGGQGGLSATFLVTSEDSNGAAGCVQHTLGSGLLAAPPHVHQDEDEISFILEGELGVQLGDQEFTMSQGQMVFKPRGVLHTFWNPGSTTVRLLEFIVPGGFEQFFAEAAEIIPGDAPPDLGKLVELAGQYNLTFEFDRLGDVMSKHGVVLPGPPPQ